MPTVAAVSVDWNDLADRVLEGRLPTPEECRAVVDSSDVELLSLLAATYRVRRQHFGNRVQLYYLKNAKSGLCPEDCGYCSQSVVSEAPIDRYPMLNEERLLESAARAAESGAQTYCIVASGRAPSNREVQHVAAVAGKIKQRYGLHICACLGLLSPEHAETLAAGGVDRVNHNLNTSRRHHEAIVSTHTFEDRLRTLEAARGAGLELCSGLIVGMGEETADVVEVALKLRELRVQSIPVNFLNAIDGTPLESCDHLDPRYCLKVLCLYRLTNPDVEIRVAGGREVNLRSLQPLALYAANSIFVSDYLTTPGQPADEDHRMIADLGFEVVPAGCEAHV